MFNSGNNKFIVYKSSLAFIHKELNEKQFPICLFVWELQNMKVLISQWETGSYEQNFKC